MAKPGKAPKKAKTMAKGHATTKIKKPNKLSYQKGKLSKRTSLVRDVIREVADFAPYERKMLELLQMGGSKDEKKALKLGKRRLGNHSRGLKKRENLRAIMQKQRAK